MIFGDLRQRRGRFVGPGPRALLEIGRREPAAIDPKEIAARLTIEEEVPRRVDHVAQLGARDRTEHGPTVDLDHERRLAADDHLGRLRQDGRQIRLRGLLHQAEILEQEIERDRFRLIRDHGLEDLDALTRLVLVRRKQPARHGRVAQHDDAFVQIRLRARLEPDRAVRGFCRARRRDRDRQNRLEHVVLPALHERLEHDHAVTVLFIGLGPALVARLSRLFFVDPRRFAPRRCRDAERQDENHDCPVHSHFHGRFLSA